LLALVLGTINVRYFVMSFENVKLTIHLICNLEGVRRHALSPTPLDLFGLRVQDRLKRRMPKEVVEKSTQDKRKIRNQTINIILGR